MADQRGWWVLQAGKGLSSLWYTYPGAGEPPADRSQAEQYIGGGKSGQIISGPFPTVGGALAWISAHAGGGGSSGGQWWIVFTGPNQSQLSVEQGVSKFGVVNGHNIRAGPYATQAQAQAALSKLSPPASGGGGTSGGGGGGGGAPPVTGSTSGFSGATHGPDVALWLVTPLCRTVVIPQPGDLAIWGPNEHMGIVTSPTEMISALDPALGTRVTSIAGAHGGIPVYRRLLASEQAGVSSAGGGAKAQNTARLLLPRYGWSSDQFAPLSKLIAGESGWSPTARNPGSGALGIGQALGHGTSATAGTLGNDYGPQYGLSDSQAQAANSGNALQQIRWTLGYIKARYGTPAAAYAAWQSRTPHWY